MKNVWVKDLPEYLGKEINDVFLLAGIAYSQRENTKWQGLTLSDRTGKAHGKIWAEFIKPEYEQLKGKLVQVHAKVEIYLGVYELRVVSVDAVDASQYRQQDFVEGILDDDASKLQDEIKKAIQEMTNGSYRSLLESIFSAEKLERLRYLSGSSKYHHSYSGGWLVHTCEVLRTALQAVEHEDMSALPKTKINRELLIAGALLHDIGMLSSLKKGDNMRFSVSARGRLVGPIYDGVVYVSCMNNALPQEEKVLDMTELLHIIVSAHGEESNIKPATKEALIVAYADQLSAAVDAYDEQFYYSGSTCTEESKKDRVYSGYFKSPVERYRKE